MDPEGKDITWTLTGEDMDDFSIEGGVLTFNESPDFENPTDRGTGDSTASDNIYDVTVVAADKDTEGMMRSGARHRNRNQRGRGWRGNPVDVAAAGRHPADGYADRP